MTEAELSDRALITDVLLRYYRGCDRWDAELIRQAFFDDATLDYGPYFRGGLDDFMTYAEGPEALGGFDRTMHFVGNLLIELDGDAADTETYVTGFHTTKPEHVWAGAMVVVYMRYVDRLERRDGRWAIADRVVAFEWVRREPADAFQDVPAEARGRRDREDAVYRRAPASA